MTGSDLQYKNTPLNNLKGIGPKFSEKFYNLGLHTIYDLILNLPFRFEDRTFITDIVNIDRELSSVQVKGTIVSLNTMSTSRSKLLKVTIKDNTGYIDIIFFNTYQSFVQNFKVGREVLILGPVKYDMYNKLNFMHPEIEFLYKNSDIKLPKTLTPVYHLTDKLPQKVVRKCEDEALKLLNAQPFYELLDPSLNPFNMDINTALNLCHNPYPNEDHEPFILDQSPQFKRLCFEELIAYQLTLLTFKDNIQKNKAIALKYDAKAQDSLLQSLSFTPTHAQIRVFNEIIFDVTKDDPMHRLVHGDVGSGKTLVAIMLSLQVAKNQGQVALLAPTELLAMQHYKNITKMLSLFDIKVSILISSQSAKERAASLAMIQSGQAQIVIGTHSLYQDEVIYKNLICVIIDEQHRFGIEQRQALLNKAPKSTSAHLLVMTATPIPRTLQLALYSDLDVSTIDELPPNRTPIVTTVMPQSRRKELCQKVSKLLDARVQVYWVCPTIETNEDSDCISVTEIYNYLKDNIQNHNISLLHGKMKNEQKRSIMQDFIEAKTSILVATTIIEVGVDVPNASVIIIESAERLGLAQLHQLRGRVGRGSKQSFCILVYNDMSITDIGKERLLVMKETTNGFNIATKDLELRGPGEVIGNAQSGFNNFKVADVNRDNKLIQGARDAALKIIDNKNVTKALIDRWFYNN